MFLAGVWLDHAGWDYGSWHWLGQVLVLMPAFGKDLPVSGVNEVMSDVGVAEPSLERESGC